MFSRLKNRQIVRAAFEKCIEAVQPRPIVRDSIKITPDVIRIADAEFPRTPATSIVLVAFGKASLLMANGARDVLKAPLLRKTLLVAPDAQKEERKDCDDVFFAARNNLPDENSVSATRHVISEIQRLDSIHTIFLFLISGGGSALFCSPCPQISLVDKLETIKMLQSAGATIQELNTIRQRLSEVKGGRLLDRIHKGKVVSLIISDIIGNPVGLIASGPTVPRSTTEIEIPMILDKYPEVAASLSLPVKSLLNSPDTLSRNALQEHPQNFIISSNSTALQAASQFLSSLQLPEKLNIIQVTTSLSGNATEIGHLFADLISGRNSSLLAEIPSEEASLRPLVLLFGGETTVKLAENPGKGGRNQEIVLACLDRLKQDAKEPREEFCFLSAGTDGQDGPTSAAGAIISNEDLVGPSPSSSEYLIASDSFNFWCTFKNGECHVMTGPSGTNVMDIQIVMFGPKLL